MSPNDYFQEVVDLHIVFRGKYKLSDILVVALGRYLCGGDNDESMYELCQEYGEPLAPLEDLSNGLPRVGICTRVL